MVRLTLEGGIIQHALTFPVLDEKLLYALLLVLEGLNGDLLTVGQISAVKIYARLVYLRDCLLAYLLILGLPQFFDVQVQHVEIGRLLKVQVLGRYRGLQLILLSRVVEIRVILLLL